MNFLSNLVSEFVAELLLLLFVPVLIYRWKMILNFLRKKFERWHGQFIITLAKKDLRKDPFRIALIMVIAAIFAVVIPFQKFEGEFQKLDQEFTTLKIVHDSLYNRVKQNKLRFANYEDELKDIRALTDTRENNPEIIRTTTQLTLIEHDQMPRFNRAMLFLNGFFFFANGFLYSVVLYIMFLFIITRIQDMEIKDFEWKLTRLKSTLSEKELIDLEVEWSNMKTGDDHKTLMGKINGMISAIG